MNLKTIKGVKQAWIAAILVLLVAGGALVFYPFLNQNAKLADDIKMSEQDKSSAQAKLAKMNKLKDETPKVTEADATLSKILPATASTPELVQFVQDAAAKSGMSSSDITDLTTSIPKLVVAPVAAAQTAGAPASPSAAPADAGAPPAASPPAASPSGNLAEMTVSISAKGSPDQLQKFVANLNTGSRNLAITGFSISKEGADGSSVKVDGTSYIYKTISLPVARP